ncbi:MAG: spermidine/putrescine ABC transporter substrate-binding protein [Gammaproteobacteria bacterium]|nr:MAG: spermidine/putrescine ABC transporter substrate-binding protein [Gammaproteobacteria bacterium]
MLYRLSSAWGIIASVALLCGTPGAPLLAQDTPDATQRDITFTTWTGVYMRSQMLGFVRPYEAANDVRVHVEHYDGGLSEIRDQVESANVIWDVVDLTQADSMRACKEGLLEDLSDVELPDGVDGTPFRDDFMPGALSDCGVGVIEWATAFAYSNDAFGDNPPSSIQDFFDTENFPGVRAVRNDPTVVMEWALMADGVARDDVYATLETEEGVTRALRVMDAIRPGLRLWSTGLEPVRLLNSNDVVMSSIWSTTGAAAAKENGADFSIVYDGRVLELDLFGIPKGSRNREAALEFIKYASSSQSLANMVSHLANGPTRRSSLALLSEETLEKIPNSPVHDDELSIISDADWWSRNHARLEEAFENWLETSGQHGPAGTTR